MLRSALDHHIECGVEAERAHALLSMGELAQRRGNHDAAMDWTGQAIDLAEQRSEVVALAIGYQQLGELHADRAAYDRFDAYFMRAIEILDRADLPERRRECEVRYRNRRASIEGRQHSQG